MDHRRLRPLARGARARLPQRLPRGPGDRRRCHVRHLAGAHRPGVPRARARHGAGDLGRDGRRVGGDRPAHRRRAHDGVSWRWVFFVNVPIGALTLWFLLARMAETTRRAVRPDFLGASLGAFALSASLFSMLLYITLYLQDILGYSPLQAGLRFLALTLLVLLVAPIAGRMSERLPVRVLLGAGLALVAVGLGLMTLVDATSAWTALLAGFVVAGAGSGLTNPPLASAAIGTVGEAQAGVGSGVNNTARQVGVAAGIAALGAVFQSRVHSVLVDQLAQAAPQLGARREQIAAHATAGDPTRALQSLPPQLRQPVAHALRVPFVDAFDRILWISAALSLAGALLAVALVRGRDFVAAPRST